jgi:NAD(P)-dependent dehydrogenase (short-subunit alcohol dehydrogenase family)
MKTETKVNNQTAVIIGGTGDIGHATAHLFVEAGANVIITGRERLRTEQKASALGSKVRGRQSIRPMKNNYTHFLLRSSGELSKKSCPIRLGASGASKTSPTPSPSSRARLPTTSMVRIYAWMADS